MSTTIILQRKQKHPTPHGSQEYTSELLLNHNDHSFKIVFISLEFACEEVTINGHILTGNFTVAVPAAASKDASYTLTIADHKKFDCIGGCQGDTNVVTPMNQLAAESQGNAQIQLQKQANFWSITAAPILFSPFPKHGFKVMKQAEYIGSKYENDFNDESDDD